MYYIYYNYLMIDYFQLFAENMCISLTQLVFVSSKDCAKEKCPVWYNEREGQMLKKFKI